MWEGQDNQISKRRKRIEQDKFKGKKFCRNVRYLEREDSVAGTKRKKMITGGEKKNDKKIIILKSLTGQNDLIQIRDRVVHR